jgi:DNA-binding response OmpR family regulator
MEPARPVVLVVEDDPAVSELLQRLLEHEGYTVEIAVHGTAGLARIQAGGIDLVLLDVMLPDIDGREICRRVRAYQDGIYVPIIMVTALGFDSEQHAGFAVGADDYVAKPFKPQELLDRVRVWVRTRQYLKAFHESKRKEHAEDEAQLAMALTTSHDLIRLLMLVLNLLESWEASGRSGADANRLSAELREAAAALAARINLLARAARTSATRPPKRSSGR